MLTVSDAAAIYYAGRIRACLEGQPEGASFGDLCSWCRPAPRWPAFFRAVRRLEADQVVVVQRDDDRKIRWVERGRRWT